MLHLKDLEPLKHLSKQRGVCANISGLSPAAAVLVFACLCSGDLFHYLSSHLPTRESQVARSSGCCVLTS